MTSLFLLGNEKSGGFIAGRLKSEDCPYSFSIERGTADIPPYRPLLVFSLVC